jgi:hypothetical protein
MWKAQLNCINISAKLIKVFGIWSDERWGVKGGMDSLTGFVYVLFVYIKFKIMQLYKQPELSLRFT